MARAERLFARLQEAVDLRSGIVAAPAFLRTLRRALVGNPTRLDITPPEPGPQRHGLGVVLIAKDEARHIRDWLTFHRIAGARRAIVYDNGSTDGMADLARSVEGIEVIVLPWVTDIALGTVPLLRQPLAYAHAVCTFGADLRWMACIDIDEYLVPVSDLTLLDALSPFGGQTNVSIPWTMFGPGGHADPPDDPAIYAYRVRARRRLPAYTYYKVIFDPTDVTRLSPHKIWTQSAGARTVNDRGEVAATYKARDTEAFATSDRIQLNHYYTFSEKELARKMERMAVSGRDQRERAEGVARVARQIDEDTVADDLAPDFLRRHGIEDARAFRMAAREK